MSVVRLYTAATRQSGQPVHVAPASLRIQLSWNPGDPHAVTMAFPTRPEQAPWAFSRDLLEQGMSGPVGEGDVHCAADVHNYVITLIGHGKEDGLVLGLVFKVERVSEFLSATAHGDSGMFDAHLDWALTQILEAAA